jgi:hypothetical protein
MKQINKIIYGRLTFLFIILQSRHVVRQEERVRVLEPWQEQDACHALQESVEHHQDSSFPYRLPLCNQPCFELVGTKSYLP